MEDSLCHLDPTELASVESGFCTTASALEISITVVQKPENHRDKLGGVTWIRTKSKRLQVRLALH